MNVLRMSIIVLVAFLTTIAVTVRGQTPQFKGHVIGESAEQFFSTATVAESHQPTVEYCTTLLGNPQAMKKHLGLAMPAEMNGCQKVMDSLHGMDADVGNRYASALGVGTTRFHSGKLIYMEFDIKSPYGDVVADMTSKLKSSPEQTYVTYQNGFGASFQRRKATWASGNLIAGVEESPPAPYRAEAVIVTIMDAKGADEVWQRREATRPNTLDAVPAQSPTSTAVTPAQAEVLETLKANSEVAKTSPAAAAAMATDGKQLSPQEQADLVKKGLASRCAIITSPAGAEIGIDGNRAGISPLALVLIKRDHPRVITIKMDGYQVVEKQVVPDGKTIPVAVQLERLR